MPDKILKYLRQNTIALLALFVALGGTSYAAFSISGNQIRNWSIDAVKLNPQSIAGLIKARVELQFKGSRLVATSSSAPVRVTTVGLGEYIQWVHQRFSAKCMVLATAHVNANNGSDDGHVNAQLLPPSNVILRGFGSDGSRRPQAAS